MPKLGGRITPTRDNEPQGGLLGQCADRKPVVQLEVGRLYGKKFVTQREAMDEVMDWLTFYNHARLHSTLGYVSPMQFEANWRAGQAKQAA